MATREHQSPSAECRSQERPCQAPHAAAARAARPGSSRLTGTRATYSRAFRPAAAASFTQLREFSRSPRGPRKKIENEVAIPLALVKILLSRRRCCYGD